MFSDGSVFGYFFVFYFEGVFGLIFFGGREDG